MFADVVRIYEKDGKYLVLNPTVPSWIVTNINGVLILKCYDAKKTFEEIAKQFCKHCSSIPYEKVILFLNRAKKAKLFEFYSEHIYNKNPLNAVYLNMTSSCNLNCTYCFAKSREEFGCRNLTLDNYFDLLNQVKQMSSFVYVNFTGGEPLLSSNTIPVAKYSKRLGFKNYLLSNGTLINKDNIRELLDSFDYFKISMDGSSKELYEKYRGAGNFEKVSNAVNLLIEHNANVMVSMVVTKENKHDIYNMCDKWGDRINFMPLFPMGNAIMNEKDSSLTGEEYYSVLSSDARIEPFSDLVGYLQNKDDKCLMKCAMCDGEISISSTGDVYPCQLLHEKDFYLGNVFDENLSNILKSQKANCLQSHTVEKIDGCRTCDFRYICAGACQARHLSETGSISVAGAFCEYEKNGIINGIINNSKIEVL